MGSLNSDHGEGGGSSSPPAAEARSSAPTHAPEHSNAPRAFFSRAAWTRLLLVLIIGLAADLGSKWWAFENVAPEPVRNIRQKIMENPDYNVPHHKGVQALPWGLLEFQLVINHGAVFGIGANRRFFFIAFTLGALAAGLLVFGRFTTSRQALAHVAIGLILAGGIGNLYDRIVCGVVRDFLHMFPDWNLPFGWTWWGGSPELFPWVFNIADVMLLCGMGLLILHLHRLEKRVKAPEAAASQSPAQAQ